MSTVTFEEFLAGAEVVSVDPPSIPEVPVDAEVSFQVYDEGTRRRIERRGGGLLGETSVRIVENEMVITEGILPRLSDIQPPENGYKEKGQYVTDFTVRMPKAMDGPNHVADLCICLHSRMAHHSILGAPAGRALKWASGETVTDACNGTKPDGRPCTCAAMNPVAPRASKHAFQRGQKVLRRRASDLMPGQKVLVGWAPTTSGRVRLLDQKTGAMVAEVLGKRGKLPPEQEADIKWSHRMWLVRTDLGESLPIAGGDIVGVVVS
jgi:hypothetical protein